MTQNPNGADAAGSIVTLYSTPANVPMSPSTEYVAFHAVVIVPGTSSAILLEPEADRIEQIVTAQCAARRT